MSSKKKKTVRLFLVIFHVFIPPSSLSLCVSCCIVLYFCSSRCIMCRPSTGRERFAWECESQYSIFCCFSYRKKYTKTRLSVPSLCWRSSSQGHSLPSFIHSVPLNQREWLKKKASTGLESFWFCSRPRLQSACNWKVLMRFSWAQLKRSSLTPWFHVGLVSWNRTRTRTCEFPCKQPLWKQLFREAFFPPHLVYMLWH